MVSESSRCYEGRLTVSSRKYTLITAGKAFSALSAVFIFFALCTSSYAQSNRDVVNRLNRLENDINTLSRAIYRGEAPPTGALNSAPSNVQADTEVRFQQMESEIRRITGKFEELTHENKRLRADLDRVTGDIMLRMQDLERRGAVGADSASSQVYNARPSPHIEPQSGASSNKTLKYQDRSVAAKTQTYGRQSDAAKRSEIPLKSGVKPLGTIRQALPGGNVTASSGDPAATRYEHAFSLLRSGRYEQAQGEFLGFLADNPDHLLAGNAKYWLGETYYVRGSYDEAARIFAEGYQQYPRGAKAPDNLLKLGLSLASLGSANDACLALSQLEKEFPNGAGPVLRRAKQEKIRLGC